MYCKLMEHAHLSSAVEAGRTAWSSFHKGGDYNYPTDEITPADLEFLDRIVNKNKHESVIEQITYNISIKGISRALLQQWSRSRLISQTVRSTRYVSAAKMGLKQTDNEELDEFIVEYFNELLTRFGHLSKDILKYGYPEAVTTDLIVQMNARELRHILSLRTSKAAMKEYRDLMVKILDVLPREHMFLYRDYV